MNIIEMDMVQHIHMAELMEINHMATVTIHKENFKDLIISNASSAFSECKTSALLPTFLSVYVPRRFPPNSGQQTIRKRTPQEKHKRTHLAQFRPGIFFVTRYPHYGELSGRRNLVNL